jgi:hypothetical protein
LLRFLLGFVFFVVVDISWINSINLVLSV